MKQFEAGDPILREIEPSEFSAVERVVENALQTTFDDAHGDGEVPAEEEREEHLDQRDFFGERGAAFKIVLDRQVIGDVFIRFAPAEKKGTF
jgi:hypothetical protein